MLAGCAVVIPWTSLAHAYKSRVEQILYYVDFTEYKFTYLI